ncbi:ExbD/TolR family protein [Telmatospirillum siberiense]|uniref:Biopolymer transporter ExbD n=1 Tax=Telmatospirillum siberiense TaxID=382514 RepID=A0A2N3PPS9_9PROT|nr:biopolymer transporter ExbD [Telmatospirillum siberiense]PKU22411.1 biopolymer transporter ExbD [Telmatospirillum siberiense]
MRSWPDRRERRARIEIIPMIDVMMFLLAFFVLISMNVLPALGLKVQLPESAQTEKVTDLKKVTLTIDKDGRTFLDGQPYPVDQLAPELRRLTADKKTTVIIAGDGGGHIQTLVDVLDTLKEAGVSSASIIAKAK